MFGPIKILCNAYLLPLIVFAAGFVWFKTSVTPCGKISDSAHIFVLTGDARRIPFAIKRLERHPQRKLYVIGAGTPSLDTDYSGQIKIENKSKTTYENALAIKQIVRSNFLVNITVVTTEDHMNRALFLIKKELPMVKINACPVPLVGMAAAKRLERWIQEYIKFIGTLLDIKEQA